MWCCLWPIVLLGCCCGNRRRRPRLPDYGRDRVFSVTGSYFPPMNIHHGDDRCASRCNCHHCD